MRFAVGCAAAPSAHPTLIYMRVASVYANVSNLGAKDAIPCTYSARTGSHPVFACIMQSVFAQAIALVQAD